DFDPTPSRIFGQRVLELKEQGVNEQDAIDVADTEYRLQKKSKKKAYKRLKEIAKLRGTKPPPNPYPSAVKEIQAEEKKYVQYLFFLMDKRISDFDPTPSRIFGQRVLELKEQGVNEQDAIDVADTEYRLQKKSKKKAYKRLKEIAKMRGTKPPPNPYPSDVKEIQTEEKK
ncbi:hypothetical protein Tco_1435760, partial [Tanacetum coccineum]